MNKSFILPAQQEKRRKRNALAISLITGVLFTLVSAIVGPIAYRQNGTDGLWGIGLTVVVSLSAFIGAYQISRERISLGIGILIITILLMSLALPVVAHGQGIALGVMIIVFVAGISLATLPSNWALRAIFSAFIIASIITLTDLYFPGFGLPTDPRYTNPIAIVVSLTYILIILRRFNSYTLRTKITIAFILITIIPVITLGLINSRYSSQAFESQSKLQLTTLAKVIADRIDEFINTQLDSVLADSKQLSLVTYLQLSSQLRSSSVEEENARLTLMSMTRKDPIFIHSIAVLDLNGTDILDTQEDYKNREEGYYPYFSRPIKTGLPYASNIIFRNNKANIYFTAPIKTQGGKIIGALRIEYHATIIQSIVRSLDPGISDTIISLVDSSTYMRAGYTGNRDDLFKSYKNFSDTELVALQSDGRLPSDSQQSALKATDNGIVAGMDNLQLEPFFNAYSQSFGSEAINTGVFLQTQPWIALIHQSTNVYLSPVKEQNKITILFSLVLIILSIAIGFIISQVLTSPLISLSEVAEQIADGDIHARANINSQDEIGRLSTSFNRMTDELNLALNGLETRVAERTADLEIAQKLSEGRANELQSISEISKVIIGEQKLENLLPLITSLVSERFGFYHTGIFLIDETRQFAILQAANSVGGKKMLDRGHRLEVGEGGIVGYVAKNNTPRIALDVGKDAVYFNNPDLPNTRSEMALPLSVRGNTIGVLDIQSENPGAFIEDDAKTLGILADQISTALENARLFAQTQQALNEAQALYRQNLKEGWATFSREESLIGYRQNMKGGKKITEPVETDEIRAATNRGNVMISHADGITEEATIVVPIKLRGQIIGSLSIKAPSKGRQWSADEINLTEVISERLSIALENARLIQESQRQLIKEQTISDVTGKIGASINLKNVLQTAVEELGHAIPGSEVMIRFKEE